MKLETFEMERLQSKWEHRVAWNLAESGVHPLRVEELVESEQDRMALLAQPLGYSQTNGTVELRTLISSIYGGAGPEHVQVTNGGSEANCITLMHLLEPGDDVIVMMPNYMQVRRQPAGMAAGSRPPARPRHEPDARDPALQSEQSDWRQDVGNRAR